VTINYRAAYEDLKTQLSELSCQLENLSECGSGEGHGYAVAMDMIDDVLSNTDQKMKDEKYNIAS
jgi:hypothetical protein